MSRSETDVHSAPTTSGLGRADTLRGGQSDSGEMLGSESPESMVGQRIANRYSLLDLLGIGGMGAVYLARDDELDELVALKILRNAVASSPAAVELLRREVRLARRVTHRNVARIFALDEHRGERFLTMEYVAGESLAALLRRDGRLAPVRSAEILLATCAGLQASHDAGVIHRDIKPDNVLVAQSGRVVISDFGVALHGASRSARPDRSARGRESPESEHSPESPRSSGSDRPIGSTTNSTDSSSETLVKAGAYIDRSLETPVTKRLGPDDPVAGTPAYMAPEQIATGEVSERSDVYSLGVMAFEMLTGQLPWLHIDPGRGRLNSPPPDPRVVVPELPESLCHAVIRALACDPEERTESPMAFAAEVSRSMADVSGRPGVMGRAGTDPGLVSARALAREKPKRSVAVLPFHNRGPSEDNYMAVGFTEDLIDRLSSIPELRVLSRAATARFASDPREVHEIGVDMSVSTIIEGSIERSGGSVPNAANDAANELLIKVRAIDTEDGVQWWADRYVVSAEDLLAASDRVAEHVATSLAARKRHQRPSAMPSAGALDAYLHAKHAYAQFVKPAELLRHFEKARALAGDNPLVDAGYAMALMRAWMLSPRDTEGLVDRARKSAQSAMTAAPHLGEPHLALGLLALHLGDPVSAMREIRAAIALAPSMPEAHAFLGMLLGEMGHVDEAIRRLEAASRLDPTLKSPDQQRRRISALTGDWELAYALFRKMRNSETSIGWLSTMRLVAYRGDGAYLARIAESMAAMPEDSYGVKQIALAQAAVYLGTGAPAEAYALLSAEQSSEGVSRRRLAYLLQMRAEVASFVGDRDIAIEAITRASGAGLVDLLWLEQCPLLDCLRDDERFATLRAKVEERTFSAYDAMWAELPVPAPAA